MTFPVDLRSLLQEANGAEFGMACPGDDELSYFCLLWSTEEIRTQNLNFRAIDKSLASLLFFASLPNGDPMAFRVFNGCVSNPAVVAMSHEDYGARREISASLRDYLSVLLAV